MDPQGRLGDTAAMSQRVLLVELDGPLAGEVTERLSALGFEAQPAAAEGLLEHLVAEPPDLAIVNLELSQGSGFGLVNRASRMEALVGLKIVLVAEKATEEALEAHRTGPTPAAAYVRRPDGASDAAVAGDVAGVVEHLLAEPLPEADAGDLVEVDRKDAAPPEGAADAHEEGDPQAPLTDVIAELGYRVLRRLRDEAGGAVFACMDDELHRAVAVKLLPPLGAGDDSERLLRFDRERRILALLHSPHVVSIYGAGTVRGIPYLARELIDGESVAGLIAREGPLDVTTALQRARDTAVGLKHAAAAGVIHRDVRPDNIYVFDGNAKLAGFGMGKRNDPDEKRITQAGLSLPDTVYVAPERARGQEDARGDIYALGVTLHTMIAGAPPFTTPTPIDLITGRRVEEPVSLASARPGTPATVVSLVAKLMAEDPAARPQDYDEVLLLIHEATRAALVGEDAPDAPEPVDEPSAVHGTLRLMSVVEIVQSLELAKRTATVSVLPADGPEGKLAFDAGRLVHASFGGRSGEDAFYALVDRKQGAFRVEYEPIALEPNTQMPTAALLLEAARRSDVASMEPRDAGPTPTPLATQAPGFFDFASDAAPAADSAPSPARAAATAADDDDDLPKIPPRQVSTGVGFAALAVAAVLFTWAGLHMPVIVPLLREDGAAQSQIAERIAKARLKAYAARAARAGLEKKLAAFEASAASTASAHEAAHARAEEARTVLEAALKPELAAGRFTLRMSDEGDAAVLEIGERALFAADGDEVIADGKNTLARIAGALAPLADLQVRVEGHTDSADPPRRHNNNWGFSGARAMAVARFLTAQGLAPARVRAVALADTKPLASNKSAKGRARNRRIELHLLPQLDVAGAPSP